MDVGHLTQKVFAKLGREKQLIEYHDIIFKLLGIVIDFSNADGVSLKLSSICRFNPYCIRLRSCSMGLGACRKCDRENVQLAACSGKVRIYECYAGLTEILVPLYDRSGAYIGSMTGGQFRRVGGSPADLNALRKSYLEYGLDPEEMIVLFRNTKELTDTQIEGVVEYLDAIGRLIVSTHHHLMFMETVNTPDKLTLIKKYVEKNYNKPLNIAKTARHFYWSSGYFSHFFKQEVGVGFMSYVNMFRCTKAEEMLLETELSISEIAYLCGFGSISQFNRTFRTTTGRTPRSCRKTAGF